MKPLHFAFAAAIATGAAADAAAAMPVWAEDGKRLSYDVLRDGSSIGTHVVEVRKDDGRVIVTGHTRIDVRALFVRLYRYEEIQREVWQDDRLVAYDAEVDDNGKAYSMRMRPATGSDGFVVDGPKGSGKAPSGVLFATYWHPETTAQSRLLDPKTAKILDVSIVREGSEPFPADEGDAITAERYRVRGDFDRILWYGPDGRWLGMRFEVRGSRIEYRPR